MICDYFCCEVWFWMGMLAQQIPNDWHVFGRKKKGLWVKRILGPKKKWCPALLFAVFFFVFFGGGNWLEKYSAGLLTHVNKLTIQLACGGREKKDGGGKGHNNSDWILGAGYMTSLGCWWSTVNKEGNAWKALCAARQHGHGSTETHSYPNPDMSSLSFNQYRMEGLLVCYHLI